MAYELLPAKFGKLERRVVFRGHRKTISGAGEGLTFVSIRGKQREHDNLEN